MHKYTIFVLKLHRLKQFILHKILPLRLNCGFFYHRVFNHKAHQGFTKFTKGLYSSLCELCETLVSFVVKKLCGKKICGKIITVLKHPC